MLRMEVRVRKGMYVCMFVCMFICLYECMCSCCGVTVVWCHGRVRPSFRVRGFIVHAVVCGLREVAAAAPYCAHWRHSGGRSGWMVDVQKPTRLQHDDKNTWVPCCLLRATHYSTVFLLWCVCGLVSWPCPSFSVCRETVCTLSFADCEKSQPRLPSLMTACTLPALFLFRPPRASITRGPEPGSLPSDLHDAHRSLCQFERLSTSTEEFLYTHSSG